MLVKYEVSDNEITYTLPSSGSGISYESIVLDGQTAKLYISVSIDDKPYNYCVELGFSVIDFSHTAGLYTQVAELFIMNNVVFDIRPDLLPENITFEPAQKTNQIIFRFNPDSGYLYMGLDGKTAKLRAIDHTNDLQVDYHIDDFSKLTTMDRDEKQSTLVKYYNDVAELFINKCSKTSTLLSLGITFEMREYNYV